ncbi:MAG: hypothetical protein ABR542_08180 [Desulfonatronovibrio sp.]|nr:hypothetical protein [Desulfovibrionales bacterium]
MNRDDLILLADKMIRPDFEASEEYSRNIDLMTVKINRNMSRLSELEELIGTDNLESMLDNHANHGRFMHSIFTNFKPEVLVDTVIWVIRAYKSRGFRTKYWEVQLKTWIEILEKHLSPHAYTSISPVYYFILNNLDTFESLANQESIPSDQKDLH